MEYVSTSFANIVMKQKLRYSFLMFHIVMTIYCQMAFDDVNHLFKMQTDSEKEDEKVFEEIMKLWNKE